MSGIPKQIKLTREQVDFVKYMTEESDSNKAAEAFAIIMIEEGLTVQDVAPYVDKIMIRWNKKMSKK